ncbi:MAG: transaldolase [Gammaproteobacteria bacterium]|nr:transaldolase [Gammaproteobacteria bacterium]
MSSLRRLQEFGQSVWYDNIQRSMLGPGKELALLIEEDGLRGVTSNPSIFEKAINGSKDYDDALLRHVKGGLSDSRDLFFALAIEDIQGAADQLLPVYRKTNGLDGYVSLEVSPDLAYNASATIAEAKRLAERVNRPNLMIKVPSTQEGIEAVEVLTAAGININATLLFGVDRYEEIARAYLRGLRQRLSLGQPVTKIASVASFFVSRVDTLVDSLLEQKAAKGNDRSRCDQLMNKVAIANAKVAYALFQHLYRHEFSDLEAAGARPQRLLWASTGTKNPNLSDVAYIDNLIGADTVNTIPPATYKAFKDHGTVAATLEQGLDAAPKLMAELKQVGIDFNAVTRQLEDEGVKTFDKAFQTLLLAINSKVQALTPGSRVRA